MTSDMKLVDLVKYTNPEIVGVARAIDLTEPTPLVVPRYTGSHKAVDHRHRMRGHRNLPLTRRTPPLMRADIAERLNDYDTNDSEVGGAGVYVEGTFCAHPTYSPDTIDVSSVPQTTYFWSAIAEEEINSKSAMIREPAVFRRTDNRVSLDHYTGIRTSISEQSLPGGFESNQFHEDLVANAGDTDRFETLYK